MQRDSFVPAEFTIQAMHNSTDISYMLTGYQEIVINDTLFTIFLSDRDLDAINAINNLAVSIDTTFLSFTPQGIRDNANNEVDGVS